MTLPTIHLAGTLDPRDSWEAASCPIAAALGVVGARSAFLILREAFYGTTRFDDFAKRAGISEPVAAARLAELVEEGLLTRERYQDPGKRARMEYRLTDKGSDFLPVLTGLMQWGDKWSSAARVEMQHRGCGEIVHAELRCGKGHPLDASDIELVART